MKARSKTPPTSIPNFGSVSPPEKHSTLNSPPIPEQHVEITLDQIFDVTTLETVAESPVAYISRACYRTDYAQTPGELVAIKSASVLPEFSKQPHDIRKEARLLASISHPGVIEFLGSTYERIQCTLHYWMPFVKVSLADLLCSPTFSPHPSPTPGPSFGVQEFTLVARSLIYQVCAALAYLHDPARAIAHRDVKPRNVLLTHDGRAQLIDLGIAWDARISPSSEALWPEPHGALCPHVCSGPYRAPETIFGPTDYDPFAVDLWSIGTLCAEFFTPLRFVPDEDVSDDGFHDTDDEDTEPLRSHITPDDYWRRRGEWVRDTLFNAERGSIGLAWSIFRVRGTPDEQNWPNFKALPDANKVSFIDALPVDLRTIMPNLPQVDGDADVNVRPGHFPPEEPVPSAIDLVQRFIVYPPERRLTAANALQHPWIAAGSLLLPPGYPVDNAVAEWNGRTLGQLIEAYIGDKRTRRRNAPEW